MRRGTTPVNTIKTDMDLTGATALYVTYQQDGETVVEKELEDVEISESEITIHLTQADTLAFAAGTVSIQVRAVLADGNRVASGIMKTKVERILKDGEI